MNPQQHSRAVTLPLTTLRLEQRDRVLIARVDSPPYNFMTAAMQSDFGALAAAVDTDDSVGAVVVTGAPADRYLLHFDISDYLAGATAAPALPRVAVRALLRSAKTAVAAGAEGALAKSRLAGMLTLIGFHQTALRILESPAVWIAAINGLCAGAGMELTTFFDLRFAGESASFVMPEFSIGLNPGLGGQRLAQLIGPAKALELMLEARRYSAAEALELGLVNHVFADENLLEQVAHRAAQYATRPRANVAAQKKVFAAAYSDSQATGLTVEGVAQMSSVMSPVTIEALRRWVQMQNGGDSVFITAPESWVGGTEMDMNPARQSGRS
jgi:enoyl-CoA hydratase/carnithine racemase